jgi:hypothetical protein
MAFKKLPTLQNKRRVLVFRGGGRGGRRRRLEEFVLCVVTEGN